MKTPMRAVSVWPEMPFMRGPQGAERLRQWIRMQREVKDQCAARRRRVLAHDWARERLRLIFHLADAEQWNGYVPPVRDEHDRLNTSSHRRELMALLHDVERFEQEGGL